MIAGSDRAHANEPATEAVAATPLRQPAAAPVPTTDTLSQLQAAGGNQMVARLLSSASPRPPDGPGEPVADRIRARLGRGVPLPDTVRAEVQDGLGHPLPAVRVHRDAEAASLAGALGARAFTTGVDVFFGANQYDPSSASGYSVLAHELTHTVQQTTGPVGGTRIGPDLVVSDPGDRDERSATAAAAHAVAHRAAASPADVDNQAPTSVQRHVGSAVTVQRDDNQPAPLPMAEAAKTRAEQIRGRASARLLKVAAYNTAADRTIASYRDKQLEFATRWGTAWDRHNTKLQEGGAEAARENLIAGIVVGALASAVVAIAATAALPAAAAAASFSAKWWAFNMGASAASGVGGGIVADQLSRPSVPGPSSGQRDAEADAWRQLAQFEQSARHVSALAPKLGLMLGNAEYAIAQVRAHMEHGTTDMNWDQTLNMVSTLANWENGLTLLDSEIDAKLAATRSLETTTAAWQVPDVGALEREIWYAWISGLTDDEVLDQDEIQDHLVALGIIPDYIYMSDEDQHRAVREARAHVAEASQTPAPPSQ